MSKTILILDGDSIAFRCSAAGEERFVEVKHEPTGVVKVFKHRTEFKEHMSSRNKEITSEYSVLDGQNPQPISYVINTINQHIKRIVDEVQPDEVKIFCGEQFNFRLELPLPSKYKGNRKNNIRPVHLSDAKRHLQNKYNAPEAIGYEVDDACSIAAYEALRNGDKPIMYFYEKDQYQLNGITLLYDNDIFEYEVVPELGNLWLNKTAVKGLGLKFLAYQWICSDPVDNYCAYEVSNVRFGAKSAYSALSNCSTVQEVLLAVIKQFKTFYPEPFEYVDHTGTTQKSNWKEMMQMYYSCCYMMRSKDDTSSCLELFNKYKVEVC